jgi:hypothetical protein
LEMNKFHWLMLTVSCDNLPILAKLDQSLAQLSPYI